MNLLVFPLHRRRELINEVVHGFSTHHHEQANIFWREMAKSFIKQLVESGIPLECAKEEVQLLFYAALDEMQQVASCAS